MHDCPVVGYQICCLGTRYSWTSSVSETQALEKLFVILASNLYILSPRNIKVPNFYEPPAKVC